MKLKRLMAFVCQICPPCVLARKYPESKLAKIMAKEKMRCPFCRAYDELRRQGEF
jgi:hypothetical protein